LEDLLTLLFTGGGLIAGLGSALCAALLPLAVLGGLAIYLVRRERKTRVERETARSWASTRGVVLASTIQVRRIGKSRSEIAVVVYRYEVNGKEYQRSVIRAGDRQGRIRLRGDAREATARYPVGSIVTVDYDPANPSEAALET
jgi:hypothetical protein